MKKIPNHYIIPVTHRILISLAEIVRQHVTSVERDSIRVMQNIKYNYTLTDYGNERVLNDWLFKEYSAEIVKYKGLNHIRFWSEEQMLMFLLQWG